DRVALAAAALRDDLPVGEEQVAERHGLVERPARIPAQIEHEPADASARLAPQPGERGLDVGADVAAELVDADHPDAAFVELPGDRLELDHAPGHRDVERLVAAGAKDRQLDRAPRRAAHLLDRLVEFEAVDQLAFDMRDVVAGLDPRLVSRTAL